MPWFLSPIRRRVMTLINKKIREADVEYKMGRKFLKRDYEAKLVTLLERSVTDLVKKLF